MVGFHALADPDVPLRPADGEIAEAMWVTRADLRAALAHGDWGGPRPPLLLPGRVSIARSMLESWAALRLSSPRQLRCATAGQAACWAARVDLDLREGWGWWRWCRPGSGSPARSGCRR